MEDPIKVTSGNLQSHDTFVMDNSTTETVGGGVRTSPRVMDRKAGSW